MSRQRRSRPEWQQKVDSDMQKYMIYQKTIEHQLNIIAGIRLDGPSLTPCYKLREGSSGGDTTCQTERTVISIMTANEKIKHAQRYRATLEGIVYAVAGGDTDRLTFIQRYWWSSGSTLVRIRSAAVTSALPFLAHKNWREGGSPGSPNRTFRNWRRELYMALGELMGHWERP